MAIPASGLCSNRDAGQMCSCDKSSGLQRKPVLVNTVQAFPPASWSKEACSLLAAWLFSAACFEAPLMSLLAASALPRE